MKLTILLVAFSTFQSVSAAPLDKAACGDHSAVAKFLCSAGPEGISTEDYKSVAVSDEYSADINKINELVAVKNEHYDAPDSGTCQASEKSVTQLLDLIAIGTAEQSLCLKAMAKCRSSCANAGMDVDASVGDPKFAIARKCKDAQMDAVGFDMRVNYLKRQLKTAAAAKIKSCGEQ